MGEKEADIMHGTQQPFSTKEKAEQDGAPNNIILHTQFYSRGHRINRPTKQHRTDVLATVGLLHDIHVG